MVSGTTDGQQIDLRGCAMLTPEVHTTYTATMRLENGSLNKGLGSSWYALGVTTEGRPSRGSCPAGIPRTQAHWALERAA